MKTLLAVVITLTACAAATTLIAQPQKPAPPYAQEKFDPTRDPSKDLKETIAVAQKQNKRILLDVGGEWCGWCKKLDKFFKEEKDVAKLLKEKYLVVKVNWSPENKNEKFLSNYPKVEAFPHLFVLDKNGKFLHSQGTGELETGDHHDKAKVLPFLKKWAG